MSKIMMIKKVSERWEKVREWLDGRPYKERIGALILALIFVFILWYLILYMPAKNSVKTLKSTIDTSTQQLKIFQDKSDIILSDVEKTPDIANKRKREELAQELKQLGEQLVIYGGQMVLPNQVVPALKDLIAHQNNIELLGLQQEDEEALTHEQTGLSITLWKTSFKMELKGDYFSVMSYLKRIEKLKWRLFWDGLEYRVTNYPDAIVTITLHTLSKEEDT